MTAPPLREILDTILAWERSESLLVRELWKTEDGVWWIRLTKTGKNKTFDEVFRVQDRQQLGRLLDDLTLIFRTGNIFPIHIAKPPPPLFCTPLLTWYEDETGTKHHACLKEPEKTKTPEMIKA